MKDEGRILLQRFSSFVLVFSPFSFARPLLDFCHDGHEDRDQFIGFLDEWFEFLQGDDLCLYKQIQLVVGLIKFL